MKYLVACFYVSTFFFVVHFRTSEYHHPDHACIARSAQGENIDEKDLTSCIRFMDYLSSAALVMIAISIIAGLHAYFCEW
jgi:hypothetical protein